MLPVSLHCEFSIGVVFHILHSGRDRIVVGFPTTYAVSAYHL